MKSLFKALVPLACGLGYLSSPVLADDKKSESEPVPHVLADKEHLDIHLNKHVANLMEVIEASDKLVLLYIMHSGITHDKNG